MLTAMRFRSFIWPNNPSRYDIRFVRETAVLKAPMGLYTVQDLGRTSREMTGEGVFFGPDAYDTFRALAREFDRGGPGLLIHPVWQCASAYFTALALTQEPLENFVAYSFAFREGSGSAAGLTAVPTGGSTGSGGADSGSAGTDAADGGARYHTVVRGDTLWDIGIAYGKTVAELVALNPWIANPNLIYVGQEVRVQ